MRNLADTSLPITPAPEGNQGEWPCVEFSELHFTGTRDAK